GPFFCSRSAAPVFCCVWALAGSVARPAVHDRCTVPGKGGEAQMDARTQRPGPDRQGMADLVVRLVGDLANLFPHDVALAKVALRESAGTVGKGVAILAAVAPLVVVGYAFLNAALALALARWMPLAASVALMGLLNVLAGAVGVVVAAKAFRRPVLGDTVDELERTAVALTPERVGKSIVEARHDA